MNIGLDIDNCITNFTEYFLLRARTLFGPSVFNNEKITYKDVTTYDFSNVIPDKKDVAAIWEHLASETNMWEKIPLLNPKDWGEFLKYNKREDMNIYFLTKRFESEGRSAFNQTVRYLTNMGWIDPQVIVTFKKAEVINALDIKFMIDDAPENLEEIIDMSPDCQPVCMNQTYNRSFGHEIARVTSLMEYMTMIDNYLKLAEAA